MSGDENKRAERFLELANAYQKKKEELNFLKDAARADFADTPYKSLVDELLADGTAASAEPPKPAGLNFDSVWQRVEKVLQSGAFYFFAGLAMLFYAMHASNMREHPSLIFLIAMLGFAIMLFGTGSQAAGAIATMGARLPNPREARAPDGAGPPDGGNPPNDGTPPASETQTTGQTGARDWSPVKANAAIAGGAAVLTAIFGIGVIHYRDAIRDIFNDFEKYERIVVEACTGPLATCQPGDGIVKNLRLEEYQVRAENISGGPIPAYQKDRKIFLVAFQDDMRGGPQIRLILSRIPGADARSDSEERRFLKESFDLSLQLPRKAKPDEAKKTEVSDNANKTNELSPACRSTSGNDSCALHRIDVEDTGSRIKTHTFSLNFARPNPPTARGEQIEIQ